jgi:hypothetical protein
LNSNKQIKRNKKPITDRPEMDGYGIQPIGNGSDLIPWAEVGKKMKAARNYWIATTRENGKPHAMPVWGVWLNDTFYFGTGTTSIKARNLAHNPAIVVHLESGDDVVILEGTAERISDKNLRHHIYVDIYGLKYGLDMSAQAQEGADPTFALNVSGGFAWLESDFPNTATRYRFE